MSGDGVPVLWAVRLLPGVASAEPERDADGTVSGLRVALAPEADRAAVEAAVRRVAEAHFGDGLPEDRVRILDDAPAAAPTAPVREQAPLVPAPRGGRARIVRSVVVLAGTELTATVSLAAGARTATGSSSGDVRGGGAQRVAATAAARALEGLLPAGVRLELEHVETQEAEHPVVLVRLSLVSSDGAQRLTGTALVRDDETYAVVRATLDATNRRVEALLQ